MARSSSTDKKAKEPGRLKQMFQVFQMTRKADPSSVWWFALAFVGPVVLGVLLALLLPGQNWLAIVLWIVAGVLLGVLLFLIVLGRLAERAAYSQIEGQPGAVGAVLSNSLRRQWRSSEMPVAVHGRSQAAVYRAVGRPGVVLITEGQRGNLTRQVGEERRKVQRIVPNVAVHVLHVGDGTGESLTLHKLPRAMNKLKKSLNRNEVLAVANRLDSLTQSPAASIPKGMDPMRPAPDGRAERPPPTRTPPTRWSGAFSRVRGCDLARSQSCMVRGSVLGAGRAGAHRVRNLAPAERPRLSAGRAPSRRCGRAHPGCRGR